MNIALVAGEFDHVFVDLAGPGDFLPEGVVVVAAFESAGGVGDGSGGAEVIFVEVVGDAGAGDGGQDAVAVGHLGHLEVRVVGGGPLGAPGRGDLVHHALIVARGDGMVGGWKIVAAGARRHGALGIGSGR